MEGRTYSALRSDLNLQPNLSDGAPVVIMRAAVADDVDLILGFIKELARFEEMESSVVATPSILRDSLFPSANNKPSNAEVIILEINGVPSGFALYFYNFSTFLGKAGLYIEDIYVRQEHRGQGYGRQLFSKICATALNRNCGRVEWWCLDWNEQAIKFYVDGLGAEAMKDWTVYRLSEDRIKEVARGTGRAGG